MRWLAAAMMAAALVVAPPAAAQTPISLGTGEAASVIVDAVGTAHIAFDSGAGSTYCRLPRKARACDVRSFLPLDGAVGPQHPRAQRRRAGPGRRRVREARTAHLAGPWRHLVGARSRSAPPGSPRSRSRPAEQSVFTVGYGTSVVNVRHSAVRGRRDARAERAVRRQPAVLGRHGRARRRPRGRGLRRRGSRPLARVRRRRSLRHQRLGRAPGSSTASPTANS